MEKPAEEVQLENIYIVKKREHACQALSELCLFRCLRPDQLKPSMERFISLVLNPYYSDFRTDLLDPFLRDRNVGLPGEGTPAQSDVSPKKGRERKLQSRDTLTAIKGVTPVTPAGGKPDPSGMSDSVRSNQDSQENEPARKAKAPGERKGTTGSVAATLGAAYADSDQRTPIMLLLTSTMDTGELISDFHRTAGPPAASVVYCALYKGRERERTEKEKLEPEKK